LRRTSSSNGKCSPPSLARFRVRREHAGFGYAVHQLGDPHHEGKATGTRTGTYKGGDTKFEAWEEGSHLKDYTYKITGGTGKYQGASGGGTYIYENLTDTLAGGTYKGTIQLP
jgi:hypothetical protein